MTSFDLARFFRCWDLNNKQKMITDRATTDARPNKSDAPLLFSCPDSKEELTNATEEQSTIALAE